MSDSDLKVSVVIPTYNGARYLGEAIQSVLDQTYPHFELIVVDDVSTDNTAEIVHQFSDPRIKYILHEENRGAVAARLTGNQAAVGEIVAFLDQDDYFHPHKLQVHVDFYAQHPEVGLTYNPRFDMNPSSTTIRGVVNPPLAMTLADLVLGFPIAPSEMVLRREWAVREDIWDDSFIEQGEEVIVNGGEYVFLGRLFLAGCLFANVQRPLNYRRYHSGRIFSDLSLRCKSEMTCQEIILSDPRCPENVSLLRDVAFSNTNFIFAYYAFAQNEINLGRELFQKAAHLNPHLLIGKPTQFITSLLSMCIDDEMTDHEAQLKTIIDQLPSELKFLSNQYEWAMTTGYLIRGARSVIWGKSDDGRSYFERAIELNAEIDEYFRGFLIDQILSYQTEFGSEATQVVLNNLFFYLEKVGNQVNKRFLNGLLLVNQAFQSYRRGEYNKVSKQAIGAIVNDPKFLTNKGLLAITFRSLLKRGLHVSL